jgi:hypothetical protein
MKMISTKKVFKSGLILVVLGALGLGCNSTPPPPAATPGACTNCSAITPDSFVSALVQLAQSGQIAAGYAGSKIVKEQAAQAGWFVIWNGATQAYQAVNINEPDLGGYCTQNEALCSNLNPQSAALSFVADGNRPVFEAQSVTSGSGSVSGNLGGTYFFGNYSGSSATAVNVGTYAQGSFGTEGQQPNPPLGHDDVGNAYLLYPIQKLAAGDTITAYTVKATGQNDSSGAAIYTDTYGQGTLYSQNTDTRDTDLQQANLQQTNFAQRAATVSANFQMDFAKAVQLTTLSDKLTAIKSQGQALTNDDRTAVMQTLQAVAGVSSDDLSKAVTQQLQGNGQAANDLVETISKNLGMPSSATLRNQILPQLGLDLN